MSASRRNPLVTDASAESIGIEIAGLAGLDLDALRLRWRNLSGRRAPETLPRPLLFRLVAFRQQAAAIGDLDPASVLLLKRLAKEHPGAEERPARRATRALPPPGSILLREWKGETHRVAVTRDGFAWNGEVHASLSGVARAITGVNWNGFVFFGLTKKAKPSRGKDIAP